MISKKVLRKLISEKLKDSEILIENKRYTTAVYISGYALELALKLKICRIFKFDLGFPENKIEFIHYQNNAKSQRKLASTITQIRQIRNHNLNELLFFSGVEYKIKLNYLNEWNEVCNWDPEMRYKNQRVLKKEALDKVNAAKKLIENIL